LAYKVNLNFFNRTSTLHYTAITTLCHLKVSSREQLFEKQQLTPHFVYELTHK